MSQFNAPMRRAGGDLDVYAGLLVVAFIMLLGGVLLMARANVDHSSVGNQSGGMLELVKSDSGPRR
jgi:hypothetical protein